MIACYGEALVDLFVSPYSQKSLRASSQACLGGSVFNFCLAAQRQGMQSLYLNALSIDSFGRQFDHVLRAEGVLLDAAPCSEPTSMAVIALDEYGKATYAFHRHEVADAARSVADITAHWRPQITALHTGCLMLAPNSWPQTRQIMAHAAKSNCVLSVDANLRPAVVTDAVAYVASVQQACASAQVVKVSDDDLVNLGTLATSDLANMDAAVRAARLLFKYGETTQLVALTLGERGAWLLTREHSLFQSVPLGVVVEDTVGAGDSFAAALLACLKTQDSLNLKALQRGLDAAVLKTALKHAVSAAVLCVQRMGCNPASWEETTSFTQNTL